MDYGVGRQNVTHPDEKNDTILPPVQVQGARRSGEWVRRSLLNDPGSKLRLGGSLSKNGEEIDWDSKPNIIGTGFATLLFNCCLCNIVRFLVITSLFRSYPRHVIVQLNQ